MTPQINFRLVQRSQISFTSSIHLQNKCKMYSKAVFCLSFFIGLLMGCIQLSAQTTIKGVVSDGRGELIIGANVLLDGTYDGASSDVEGRFSFVTVESGAQQLMVSYIGYEDFRMAIDLTGKELEVNIQLKEIINELEAVVITAGSFEASDERKSVILKPLDIAMTAGATADIAGALNTLPGTQTVGETGQLFVRGGSANETRTFIDGMFVQNPYNSTTANLPSRNRFSPFLFKGTMFSTGGYSAEYGQALSSALILNTQDLAPQTLTSISLMSVGAGLSKTKRWKKSSLSLSGNYSNLAPYTSIIPQNIKWDKPFQGVQGQLVFRQETSETGIFKVYADLSSNWFAMQAPHNEDVTQLSKLKLNNNNFYFNTSYREVLNDRWSIFSGLAYTKNVDEVEQGFSFDEDEQSVQARVSLRNHVSDRFKVKFGGEYLFNDFEERFVSSNEEPFSLQLQDHYAAAFVEADFYVSNKLVLRAGERVEYSSLLEDYNTALRLSVAYQTSEYAQFSFAAGQFYQNPDKEFFRYGNEFDFERADHYILNYQWAKDQRVLRVEGYYKDYKRLVKFSPDFSELPNHSGDGYARGIDLFFRDRKTFKNIDYWLSYSFLDTERDYRDFPEAATPFFASAHNFSLVYKQWLPKLNSAIGLTYSHGSPRPYNDPNDVAFNSRRTRSFNDLSFNASYLTNLWGNFTVVYISVNNVLGFNNSFGRRFSANPDGEGVFRSTPIRPPAKRFLFVGCFISIGQKYNNAKQSVEDL
ncbi:MAG: TonB-dependent receptor [Bacteroidota bacterium]